MTDLSRPPRKKDEVKSYKSILVEWYLLYQKLTFKKLAIYNLLEKSNLPLLIKYYMFMQKKTYVKCTQCVMVHIVPVSQPPGVPVPQCSSNLGGGTKEMHEQRGNERNARTGAYSILGNFICAFLLPPSGVPVFRFLVSQCPCVPMSCWPPNLVLWVIYFSFTI